MTSRKLHLLLGPICILLFLVFLAATYEVEIEPDIETGTAIEVFVGRVTWSAFLNRRLVDSSKSVWWRGFAVGFTVSEVFKGEMDIGRTVVVHHLIKDGSVWEIKLNQKFLVHIYSGPERAGKDWFGILRPNQKIRKFEYCKYSSPPKRDSRLYWKEIMETIFQ